MKSFTGWFIFLLVTALQAISQDSLTAIRLDQEGFYTHAPKIAVIAGYGRNHEGIQVGQGVFFIVREQYGDTVFNGKLSTVRHSANSGLLTCTADFSSLVKTGKYRLLVPGCCISHPFRIEPNVHRPLAVASLKAFYFLRASMKLETRYAGKWNRAAGHPDDSVIIHPSAESPNRKAGTIISTPGGWYDAGDYNKYIVNSGISTSTLLSAYEDFKKYFDTLHLQIPSIGPGIPDILNEIIYNLRWMLTMQDPEDGGVYNKCTNAGFDAMEMPDRATQPRYVVQKGTAATLDFAAVTAQAARILSNFKSNLPGLGDSCRKASEKAWNWALKNPGLAYDQNAMNLKYDPKITTGGYGDRKFTDEWFWAACELYITTGSKTYYDTLVRLINGPYNLPSWAETGLLGYYSLIKNSEKISGRDVDSIRSRLISIADQYVMAAKQNAFLTVMGGRKSDFNWGSNSNAANQGILLVRVYSITHDRKYLDAALGNLEYICGRNATGYCFVTGLGSFSTRHPHHRPSVADGIDDPVPGLLAGGPNPGEQDHCHYDFHEPETAYVDSDCAYASNEIAINWNSPLVYLANAMEALQINFQNHK
jgi:endoglucanase